MKKVKMLLLFFISFIAFTSLVYASNIGKQDNPVKNANDLVEALGNENASAEGNIVSLSKSITYNDDLFFSNTTEDIILDMNNFDITLGDENEFILWENANLTIQGNGYIKNNGIYSTIELAGKDNRLVIDGPTIENQYATLFNELNQTTGVAISTNLNDHTTGTTNTIEIKNGLVKGTQGINVSVKANAIVKINGGTVEGTKGAAIMTNDQNVGNITLDITNGNLKANENSAIALEIYGKSNVNIFGGNITGYTGIYATNESNILISGVTINGSTYGVYGEGNSTITINGGNITGTEAGVYSEGETLDITNGTIDGRYGVVAYNGAKATISGGNITGETAAVSGNGSDPSSETTITITGGNLKGGIVGIYHPQKGKLNISGDAIIEGKVGIVARQGSVDISRGTIKATGNPDEKIIIGDAKDETGRKELSSGIGIIVDNTESSYPEDAKVKIYGDEAIIEGTNKSILSEKDTKTQDFDITGGTFLSKGIKDDVKEFFNTNLYGQSQSGLVGKVHDITFVYDNSQGSVESYTDATENEEVTFTVKPNVDYDVDSIEIKTSDNENVNYTSSSNKHTFKMPEKDVTVSIKFKVVYADYSGLYEALLKAKGIDTSKYTKESIKALLEAIEDAEKIEKGLRASQQYLINNLTYALNNAIANLVAINSNTVKPSEPVPDTYDNGSIYFGFAIITLGTMLISIKKLKNN